MEKYVVFTDLDGTLIDAETYSYEMALPAITLLKERHVPIVFCTSKTRAEIEVYRKKLEIKDPFIPENGGAIFIPENYFDFDFEYTKKVDGYKVIELGTEYAILRKTLKAISSSTGCEIIGFGDMSAEEISQYSNLDIESAKLAKMREYDEAFLIQGGENCVDLVLDEIQRSGLGYTVGGRFYHIIGDNDKGVATRQLIELFSRRGPVKTIGLGDSLNDLPMLREVDLPFLVKKPDGSYDPMVSFNGLKKARGIGPKGWNITIKEILG
ncbi:MAG: mannosyl-3-phosphoglycerate phosphatase [Candidatus Syntrophoarchaeum caldarius]|uniref:Mannosyl-3-phosphoglycerate phosphatase n=1 Tax=Candidatus Syntropharchaeum caldarium TaxID=1838285 RepID=A0A1F2PCS8_9EURY|nr:MAG: mannosyl-3-phosphoglycerate phosphatase [Candidatus Syntrophoarchaeum caldarius]